MLEEEFGSLDIAEEIRKLKAEEASLKVAQDLTLAAATKRNSDKRKKKKKNAKK